MAAGDSMPDMLRQLFQQAGLELSSEDLAIVSRLHSSFAGQRARLSGVARPETEPLTVPLFRRDQTMREAHDEPAG
jgi:hypothetical protein